MELSTFNSELLEFLASSPSQYHAVKTMADRLETAGFTRLYEHLPWETDTGGRYYVIRNDASLIAFTQGGRPVEETGFRMIGAHTDSPGLKLKPSPDLMRKSFFQAGVEVYGGPLLHTWFDRELSLAGRVSWAETPENRTATIHSALIDLKKPIAVIPNLAIHLDRDANSNKNINKQKDLPPIILMSDDDPVNFRDIIISSLEKQGKRIPEKSLFDFDLFFYDVNPAVSTGLNNDFLTGGKLDNLVSCFAGITAIENGSDTIPSLLICNDHEEVGSVSASGAAGTFLSSVLHRLCPKPEAYGRMADMSLMISADNAHGIHPNFQDKYEENHSPLLNGGPVIKVNANQRYATDSSTGAAFRYLCNKAGVPVQEFVIRTDMACGSTIGPLTAGETGIRTVDAGIPMLAMHSIRETIGSRDAYYLYSVLKNHVTTRINRN